MKIRNGFVSNSSSSSFVIACIPSESLKMTIEIDLSKCKKISTVEELDIYFNDDYGKDWKEYKSSLNKYNKYNTAIQSGKQIVVFCNSNDDDDPISNFLYYVGANDELLTKVFSEIKDVEILEYD